MIIEEFRKENQVSDDVRNIEEILFEIFGKKLENTEVVDVDKNKNKKGHSYGRILGKITDIEDEKEISLELMNLDQQKYEINGNSINFKKIYKNVSKTYENNGKPKIGDIWNMELVLSDTDVFTRDIVLYRPDYETPPFKKLLKKMEGNGYNCNEKVLAQFLCAMNTNQLIILHGAPGMGKTSFVTNIAKALEAECRVIPVRPNWVDNQELMGFFNPVEHRYYSTPFMDVLCEAKENPKKRFFICLDEMNLAHVEYYFSDILSAMESGNSISLYSKRDREEALDRQIKITQMNDVNSIDRLDADIVKKNLEKYEAEFEIPKNVTFVGTLNMDATTYDLSPKVIDRSAIIKVTKNDGQIYREKEEGKLTEEQLRGEDSFEKLLLKNVGKVTSERVEKQRKAMDERRNSDDLLNQISDADFQDMYIAMKVLPSLNLEITEEKESTQQEFRAKAGEENWEKLYPISWQYLKNMWDEQEKVLNYWRMD